MNRHGFLFYQEIRTRCCLVFLTSGPEEVVIFFSSLSVPYLHHPDSVL